MKSFRNPKYLERYEDVIFDLEQPINTTDPAAANTAQVRAPNLKFIADNTGEATPFDWYNARFSMDFKVRTYAPGNIAANDDNGIVNGSNSFIKKLTILANGREVYSCNEASHVANIKNLLEYNSSYAKSIGTKEFYYPDTTRHAERDATNANYNVGFALRKKVLGASALVNCEIPLNRYSFFVALEDKLLPNTKIEINFEIESDANLIFQAGANCGVIVKRLELYIPKLTFNAEGQKLYMEMILNLTNGPILMKLFIRQIIYSNKQAMTELQPLFQNHAMYLFGLSTQQELTHKQPIHLYMILLVIYQPMPTYHDVISMLEMVMNTLIFIINHLQI